MNINELRKEIVQEEMPVGAHEVTFEKLEYKTDAEDNVTGAYIYTKEFRRIYLHFFKGKDGEPEVNPNLDYLLAQLGCQTLSDDEANQYRGVVVKATKYETVKEDNTYKNVSFNPSFVIR